MPLLSAAISDSPTGSQAIDCRARKKSSRFVWRREKYNPTVVSAARYVTMIAASTAGRPAIICAIRHGISMTVPRSLVHSLNGSSTAPRSDKDGVIQQCVLQPRQPAGSPARRRDAREWGQRHGVVGLHQIQEQRPIRIDGRGHRPSGAAIMKRLLPVPAVPVVGALLTVFEHDAQRDAASAFERADRRGARAGELCIAEAARDHDGDERSILLPLAREEADAVVEYP